MPQPFLEPPLQSLPLTRIAHSSRSHILPCSYPPVCRSVLARVFTRRFRRLPCVNMVAWFPRRQKPPFRVPQHSSRSSSDLTKRNHPVPLASSASKSLSPCESVRASFGFPRGWWPLLSWVLASLEPPPLSPWSLKPTQPEGQALLPRSLDLFELGQTALRTKRSSVLSAAPAPKHKSEGTSPHRLLGGAPPPLTFPADKQACFGLVFGVLKYDRSGISR